MLLLILGFAALLVVLAVLLFLLGFRLGGHHWQAQLVQVRLDAAQAERQLHELTREAFVAMAEQVEQRRRS